MKRVLLMAFIGIFAGGCAHVSSNIAAPSVAPIKRNIASANTNISNSAAASQRSSAHIKQLKTNADKIDYKAVKALELL